LSASNPKISIIVCTYNRADLLLGCLQALAIQMLDCELYEVVIVDNNSTDNTQEIAHRVIANNVNFRIVSESKQGLSHARNCGWQEAVGEFIAYIDDDAKAEPDWIMQMYSFIKCNSTVEAFGGPYRAFYQKPPPLWFPPEYGTYSLGDVTRKIHIGEEFVSGTNMVFRKSLLNALGGFNTALGMKGGQLAYGEETRLLLDIAEQGVDVYYLPNMSVDHLVAYYKISLRWLLRSAYANGHCSEVTFSLRRTWQGSLFGIVVGLMKMVLIFFRPGRMPIKRRVYYSLSGLCAEWGALISYLFRREKPRG